MKLLRTTLLTILCSLVSTVCSTAQSKDVLWQYNMSDGSTIHGMSDNGKWAVAYGISNATSAYSFPKLLNFTNHTQQEILSETEINSGIECYVNDVSNDASAVVGCYNGKPAYWNLATKQWTILPLATGNVGGRLEAVTPDGVYAVGACTNGGYDEVPMMWNLQTNEIVTLEGLPSCDLSGSYQAMTRLTDLSADGRYIVGCVSYSYPEDVLYFLYDRDLKKWDAIAFDYNAITRKFTPRDEKVRTLDGITISPNGKWVAGVVYSTDDVRNPFRYNTETKVFENINRQEDLDKGCVSIDNEGTIYAATPAINPSRSLYILHNNNWYGIDEILKQQCGIDFYTYTGYGATGLCIDISDDCKTMAAIAYISDENYQITLPTTFAKACEDVNLLATYTASIRSGATIQKLSNISLTFTRDVEVKATANAATLLDENGNIVRNSLKIEIDNTSSKNVTIGFRTTTLEKGKKYSVVIPAGSICVKGDATKTNEQITLNYFGLGETEIQSLLVTPAQESTLGHIDANTNPVIFTFNVDVKVKADAKALLYRNDETEPFSTLEVQHGLTSESANMVLVYPTSTMYLYKDNTYRIVIPAATLTDAAGYASNVETSVTYYGSYERTIVSDDANIYIENFESGINNVMLYDGDGNEPTDAMKAWSFTANVPWTYAADDDYTNTCAVSHSMYAPSGASNDWMVTPQLFIPDAKCTLTFDAQSYRKAKTDVLQVIVYTCDESINELDASIVSNIQKQGDVVVEKLLSPGYVEDLLDGDWENIEVSLAPYAGKKVYIAFVNQNENQSAIFVSNIQVRHTVDFQILLNGVPETLVAQSSQAIKGAIVIKESGKTYTSARIALLEGDTTIEELSADGLTLTQGDTYNFAFTAPLPLQVGKECPFTVRVTLDNGAATYELHSSIKNLAFSPTKRVILEENTGMGCQNCPLGHLALEHLEHTYADRFIPLAYHTYTGDPLESGMTDYAQYFLTLNAAPTAMIQRNGTVSAPMVSKTEGGTTDYTFTLGDGTTWSDQIAAELATPTDADLSIGSAYDETTDRLTVYYTFTSAIDRTDANIGLLCILTEDALDGYQSNAFYAASDPDLGAWGKGGAYAKSTVYPYTFNDVARALYPSTSYYGQTGLIPTVLHHGAPSAGTIVLRVAQDAPYVKDIRNCKVTCVAICANTGRVINAARVSVGSSMTSVSDARHAPLTVSAAPEGIAISAPTPVSVTLYSANGTPLTSAVVAHKGIVPTAHRGLILVRIHHEGGYATYKVIR